MSKEEKADLAKINNDLLQRIEYMENANNNAVAELLKY
jgi:uncharacterized protein YehS (DUF1456 family)